MCVVRRRTSANVPCSGRVTGPLTVCCSALATIHAGVVCSANAGSLAANICVWHRCPLCHSARPGSFGFGGADKTSQGAGSEGPVGVEGLALRDITAATANGVSSKQGACTGLLKLSGGHEAATVYPTDPAEK